ncbi:MAG: hypothetical protein J7474_07075 [Arthrobacter sp.]|uniref:hypothetical protein n=1 Tax=Arthrobacter woluwensis TaxID=156980 RepID=UPI001B209046|nr:hypothetical protein [Arthrobacter woluwensis]MBO9705258.1 hypothetical protein [Arthrobacter sp.]MDQ0708864.1 hypothetical protein [Arthrobacter woluwensis]
MAEPNIPGHGPVARVRGEWVGRISSVTLEPKTSKPRFTARLGEVSGPDLPVPPGDRSVADIRLLWLGRRSVGGIEPGSTLRVRGMLTSRSGLATIINPGYEIISAGEH